MLQVGDKAPLFESKDQDGQPIKLADFLGKGKKVVVYFYPRDNTSGCTAQACNLRDHYETLQKEGYQIIGVSTDSEKSHQNFIKKHELPFPLVADTEKEVVEQFGVWKEKSMYGKKYMGIVRTTFIIDETGVIEEVISKVKTKEHTAQILK
ncbi:MAG: thioredoxin-dependent thiol peroxidase [Thermonemataceae bacterium]